MLGRVVVSHLLSKHNVRTSRIGKRRSLDSQWMEEKQRATVEPRWICTKNPEVDEGGVILVNPTFDHS